MQLSKDQFSKLSKRDQQMLMKAKPKSQNGQKRKNKQVTKPKARGNGGGKPQASVAAAYASTNLGKAPKVTASRDSCRVVHREFIANITGSVAYTLSQSLPVNPGLATTFPWLSVIAQAWEEYRFNKLKFCFYTRTGSNTPGSVLMSPDYDASDAAPSSEQVQSSYDETVEDAPWKDICCTLKKQLMSGPMKRHYIRNAALAANQDIKMYDIANFFVGTVDGTAVSWGKLWVEYDVEFYIPQLPPTGAVSLAGGKISSGGTKSNANPLGDAPTADPQIVGFTVGTNSIITFQTPGTYVVDWNMINGDGALTALTFTPGAGGALIVAETAVFNAGATSGNHVATFTMNAGSTLALTSTDTTGAAQTSRVYIGLAPAGSFA
jgi:hypothetical protein